MIAFRSIFSVAALIAAVSAMPSQTFRKRTIAAVQQDLVTITYDVKSLNLQLKAFPNQGASIYQALKIHQTAQDLINVLETAASDVPETIISSVDAKKVLASVTAIQPIILDALNVIVKKKPAFQGLPINVLPLVKKDLIDLWTATDAFASALINAAPLALKNQASSIKFAIDAGFQNAIAGYMYK